MKGHPHQLYDNELYEAMIDTGPKCHEQDDLYAEPSTWLAEETYASVTLDGHLQPSQERCNIEHNATESSLARAGDNAANQSSVRHLLRISQEGASDPKRGPENRDDNELYENFKDTGPNNYEEDDEWVESKTQLAEETYENLALDAIPAIVFRTRNAQTIESSELELMTHISTGYEV